MAQAEAVVPADDPAQRPRRGWAPLAVAVLFSGLGFLWLDQHGVALSRDSVHYLRVAVDLRFDGFFLPAEPAYPLGYPLLVAQAMRWEPFAVDAAGRLAWVAYGTSLLCAAALARRVAGPWPAALAVAVLATLPPVVVFHGYALSGAPFGALILLHTLLVVRSAEARGRTRLAWLASAAGVLGVATVVRVIGYAPIVVFTVYVLALAWRGERNLREAAALGLAHSPCYLPAAGIALAYRVVGRPVHGYRGGSSEPFGLNVERALTALGEDLGWALLVPAALGAGLCLWRGRRGAGFDAAGFPVGYALAMTAVYLSAVVIAATLTKVSPVGSRFFAPYYGLVLLLVLAASGLAARRVRPAASVGVSLALLFVLVQNIDPIRSLHRGLTERAEGTTLHFQQGFSASATTAAVREFLGDKARGERETSLSVLSPLPRRGHHDDGGRSLLLSRAAISSPVESARFARLGPGEMKLWLGDAPDSGGLRYVGLALDTEAEVTAESTIRAVAGAMIGARRSSHWLVVPRHVDPLVSVGAVAGLPMEIAERREIGAYRFYRFILGP